MDISAYLNPKVCAYVTSFPGLSWWLDAEIMRNESHDYLFLQQSSFFPSSFFHVKISIRISKSFPGGQFVDGMQRLSTDVDVDDYNTNFFNLIAQV